MTLKTHVFPKSAPQSLTTFANI